MAIKLKPITAKKPRDPKGYKPGGSKAKGNIKGDKGPEPDATGAKAFTGAKNKKMSTKPEKSWTQLLAYTSPGAGMGQSGRTVDKRVGVGKLGSTR
jgi:hypothetical protein